MADTASDVAHPAYWQAAAAGWIRQAQAFGAFCAPLTARMLGVLGLRPGETVLELGSGVGEVGLRAAQAVGPSGTVIISDRDEGMVKAACARARESGAKNVQCRRLDAEWIDLSVASVDALLMRFLLMLLRDPVAALKECRRVIRPGGRAAFAVWAAEAQNPWAALPNRLLREAGVLSPPAEGVPGTFALGERGLLASLLEEAGFLEVKVEEVELWERAPDWATYWVRRLDLSPSCKEAFFRLSPGQRANFEAALQDALASYRTAAGGYAVPGLALLGSVQA